MFLPPACETTLQQWYMFLLLASETSLQQWYIIFVLILDKQTGYVMQNIART